MHPQYWSLSSIYERLRYGKFPRAMTNNDIKYYSTLPVKGKIILDVGAYNGDSAKFFLDRGAKWIYCIESNIERANKIRLERTTVFPTEFNDIHLQLAWDCCKMDIEGYELTALPYFRNEERPIIVEVHNHYNRKCFEKIGFRVIGDIDEMLGLCLMVNY